MSIDIIQGFHAYWNNTSKTVKALNVIGCCYLISGLMAIESSLYYKFMSYLDQNSPLFDQLEPTRWRQTTTNKPKYRYLSGSYGRPSTMQAGLLHISIATLLLGSSYIIQKHKNQRSLSDLLNF